MNYLDKCVSKTDLLFRKLKLSPNLIVFILNENLYFAYTLSDIEEIIKDSKQHYIEGKDNLETFFYLVNGIRLDSSFKDCYEKKINTLFLLKSENKFRIGFEERKQVFSYYSVLPASRKDINSNEIDIFLELQTNNEISSDSENELDWTEIKAQQEKRLVLENERKTKMVETGNHVEINHFDFKVNQILNFDNFKLKKEKWFQNDKKHREGDLPAVICYFENENKQEEYWYQNDKKHREGDLPAVICYFENGNKQKEKWFQNDKRHHEGDLPAVIWYYENGNKQIKIWFRDDKTHREEDLPVEIYYFKNGNKKVERWFQNDKTHREGDLPAEIWYFENGNKQEEKWYQNDRLHREGDLPAEIWYYENGNKEREQFYEHGRLLRGTIFQN